MWLEVTFMPVTLFSLKKSDATNPAAKSLLCPSPYSVKMALLNSIIIFNSVDEAIAQFRTIKNLKIQFKLPKYICSNNCFVKIQKAPRSEDIASNSNIAFKPTVGFREYIYYSGEISIAVEIEECNKDYFLDKFKRINYFGKKGCFFQFIGSKITENLSKSYSGYFDVSALTSERDRIIVRMDDFDSNADFENVSTYSEKKAMRVSRLYYLNYRMKKASKNYTLFESTC